MIRTKMRPSDPWIAEARASLLASFAKALQNPKLRFAQPSPAVSNGQTEDK